MLSANGSVSCTFLARRCSLLRCFWLQLQWHPEVSTHNRGRADLRRDKGIVHLSKVVAVSALHRAAVSVLRRVVVNGLHKVAVRDPRNRVDSVHLRETSVLRRTIGHRRVVRRRITVRRRIVVRRKEGRLKVVHRRVVLTSTLIRGIATSLRSIIVRMPCAGATAGVRRLYQGM